MARTFSTSQLPKVVRKWGTFSFFTCKRASRHSGVHFFIAHLPRCLRTRRFSEPTFRPSGATKHWKKHSVSRLSYLFVLADLFLSLILSLLTFSMADLFHLWSSHVWLSPWLSFFLAVLFHLSILSEVSLLNFLRSCLQTSVRNFNDAMVPSCALCSSVGKADAKESKSTLGPKHLRCKVGSGSPPSFENVLNWGS